MEDCIFCKIIAKDIPAQVQYEDEQILVFKDIEPQAKIHWLIVPKTHIHSMRDLTPEHADIAGYLFTQVPKIAKLAGVDQSGFRILSSSGEDGGQTVPHLHVHLLGGEKLSSSF